MHFAALMQVELSLPIVVVATVRDAVADADIVCTVTAAPEPILQR